MTEVTDKIASEVDKAMEQIEGEVAKLNGNGGVRTLRPKLSFAMSAVDAKAEREARMIEALIEQAMALRIMHVRGKLAYGHNDMVARKHALEWIMSIQTDNAEAGT